MLQPIKCARCFHQENRNVKKNKQWTSFCTKCGNQVRIVSKHDAGYLDKDVEPMFFGPYKGRIISTLTAPEELEYLIHLTRTAQGPDLMRAVEAHLETVYSPQTQEI